MTSSYDIVDITTCTIVDIRIVDDDTIIHIDELLDRKGGVDQ